MLSEINVPVINLDVDCVDDRNYSEAQLWTRLEAFVCPMDIRIHDYISDEATKRRVLSTECIICVECVNACPKEVLGIRINSPGISRKELLRKR